MGAGAQTKLAGNVTDFTGSLCEEIRCEQGERSQLIAEWAYRWKLTAANTFKANNMWKQQWWTHTQKSSKKKSRLGYILISKKDADYTTGVPSRWKWEHRDHAPVIVEINYKGKTLRRSTQLKSRKGWTPESDLDLRTYRKGICKNLYKNDGHDISHIQDAISATADNILYATTSTRRRSFRRSLSTSWKHDADSDMRLTGMRIRPSGSIS